LPTSVVALHAFTNALERAGVTALFPSTQSSA